MAAYGHAGVLHRQGLKSQDTVVAEEVVRTLLPFIGTGKKSTPDWSLDTKGEALHPRCCLQDAILLYRVRIATGGTTCMVLGEISRK